MLKDALNFPTEFGEFQLIQLGNDHLALVKGTPKDNCLVRIHSSCFTSEVLGSLRCDCRKQLYAALRMINDVGEGIVIYLQQEGRGIGLQNKIEAYKLQDKGFDTVDANLELGFPADLREYSIAINFLKELNITKIKILTNNPAKIKALNGIVLERVPLIMDCNPVNEQYLVTKKERMGHLL